MKRFVFLTAILLSVSAVMSCDTYEDGEPVADVLNVFEKMYPGARDVEWEREGPYWEVSFETGSYPDEVDHSAWFTTDGAWVRTETDIFITAVPESIMKAIQESEYASAMLEDTDVDYIQTPEGNYYQFDLIYQGSRIEVNVTEDGQVSRASAF